MAMNRDHQKTIAEVLSAISNPRSFAYLVGASQHQHLHTSTK